MRRRDVYWYSEHSSGDDKYFTPQPASAFTCWVPPHHRVPAPAVLPPGKACHCHHALFMNRTMGHPKFTWVSWAGVGVPPIFLFTSLGIFILGCCYDWFYQLRLFKGKPFIPGCSKKISLKFGRNRRFSVRDRRSGSHPTLFRFPRLPLFPRKFATPPLVFVPATFLWDILVARRQFWSSIFHSLVSIFNHELCRPPLKIRQLAMSPKNCAVGPVARPTPPETTGVVGRILSALTPASKISLPGVSNLLEVPPVQKVCEVVRSLVIGLSLT
jgi:hypothetical protein